MSDNRELTDAELWNLEQERQESHLIGLAAEHDRYKEALEKIAGPTASVFSPALIAREALNGDTE